MLRMRSNDYLTLNTFGTWVVLCCLRCKVGDVKDVTGEVDAGWWFAMGTKIYMLKRRIHIE